MAKQTVKLTADAAHRMMAGAKTAEELARERLLEGGPGAKRNPAQHLFAVRVTIDGGSAGTVSTTCSWTYTVKLDSGYLLGEELTPAKCRLTNVPYETTPADSWGAGFFDKDGEFVLWDANECPQVEDPCE